MTNAHDDQLQSPPRPLPGPPQIASAFSPVDLSTSRHVLNHIALQISSVTAALAFYGDFLGMKLVFSLNAGPFSAFYLGYSNETDECPLDIAKTMAGRSGLLELIVAHDDEQGNGNGGATNQAIAPGPSPRVGLAHLGFRVPDVDEVLDRAQKRGYNTRSFTTDTPVRRMPMPSWAADETGRPGQDLPTLQWQGGFEATLMRIGFVQDPDG